MTLGANSLDQLARVRRLLQRFTVPDPGVRLITLDAEAHAAALDPQLAVLDPAPFGGLGNVEAQEVSGSEGSMRERRASRASQTSGDAARRQRRQEMLKPSRLPQSMSKLLSADASKPASTHQLPSISPATSKRPAFEVSTQNQLRVAEDSRDDATPAGKNPNVAKLVKQADDDQRKVVSFSLAPPGKEKSGAASEETVELGTLVRRVLQKRREGRNSAPGERGGQDDALQPSASPTHARLHGATVTQRPLPSSVVLPVSPAVSSAPRHSALVVTQRTVRSSLTELGTTPNAKNKRDATEPDALSAAATPTFFFNALESREAEESEATLTDRIDQVLREQARRQGVDLT